MSIPEAPSPPPGRYRLLVFDWDGTLMDSVSTIVACTQQALADLGLPARPAESIRRTIGMGLRDAISLVHPGTTADLCDQIAERYRHHWLTTHKDMGELFPGAEETLRALHRGGYELAIATAKSRRGLQRELEKSGLGGLVSASRTLDESPPKPDPGMLLDLMAELDCTPGQTLMIGDTTWDLEMAKNAGVAAVAVESGAHGREDLLRAAPLACILSVTALPAWLGDAKTAGEG